MRNVAIKLSSVALAATALGSAATASAAETAFIDEATFDAQTAGLSFSSESFEGAPGPGSTATSLNFSGVNFSCSGSSYCPGFFGQSNLYSTDGLLSVYFATPDLGIFTFAAPISAFAIDVIGMGDVGMTNFFLDIGSGPLALQQNYSVPGGTETFAGVTSDTPFTTVTFSGSQTGDGVFFDNLRFSLANARGVPEPATWALLLFGFGAVGGMMRSKNRKPKIQASYA